MNKLILLSGMFVSLWTQQLLFGAGSEYFVLADTGGFSANLDNRSQSIETIESEFIQLKHLDILAEDVKSSGYFCYQRPSKVRWEYLKPFQYLIVINDKNVYIKDGDKIERFNAGNNKIFSEINAKIMESLRGGILSNNSEFIFKILENDTQYLVVMNPKKKNMQQYVKDIRVFFDKTDFSIASIEINEISGDYTKIIFKNKKMNAGLDENKFIVN